MPPAARTSPPHTAETVPDLLLSLSVPEAVEDFLLRWEAAMQQAGYLEHTTAKRSDCIRSYEEFLTPVWRDAETDSLADFAQLLPNANGWADPVLATSRRHRARGVTPEMFIGCFATLVQSVVDCLLTLPAAPELLLRATRALRNYGDALSALLIADWAASSHRESTAELDSANRSLTLQKNKYENILASTSDAVLVVDGEGEVIETNQAARGLLGQTRFGRPVWAMLGLEGADMAEVLNYYPPEVAHELSLYDEGLFLEMKIAPLNAVSLASRGYLFLLTDITGHVTQREILEERVQERTRELEREKSRLEEMNITLRTVMRSIEQDKNDMQQTFTQTVENLLLPTLSRLAEEDAAEVRRGYTELLKDQLFRLNSGQAGETDSRMLKLTPSELKVCQFIQSGAGSKEIAESLNLSLATVQTHRKNIRGKLGLHNKSVNLYAYLTTARGQDALPTE